MTVMQKKDENGDKVVALSGRRTKAKFLRQAKALEAMMEQYEENFESYVRIHRLVYGCDPKLEDISDKWDEEE
jgi:hypothetical protein